ncbi:hypothetical protein GCM10020000_37160 [Streptomyces olivoverticillatus]
MVTKSQLSTVVFRYLPAPGPERELADDANLHAREALAASGDAVVAGTKVDGHHYLKFTLLNPETSLDDIAHVLDLLADHAGRFIAEKVTPRAAPQSRLNAALPPPPLAPCSPSARETTHVHP